MRDLRSLTMFWEVARSETFSAAARKLNVTPAAVSKSVAKLEQQLNSRLFNRTTREVRLTTEGERLLAMISGNLLGLEAALEAMDSVQRPSGRLRVSLVHAYGKAHVIPRLPLFCARYPDIDLEIGFDDERLDYVRAGFDVGVCYGEPKGHSYISRVLRKPRLVLVASPDYLARRGCPRTPQELQHHDCINVRLRDGRSAAWVFRQGGGEPYVHHPKGRIVVIEQLDAVLHAAAAGLGLTVVHAEAAAPMLRAGELSLVLEDYEVRGEGRADDVRVVYAHREHQPLRLRLFIDFLVEIA